MNDITKMTGAPAKRPERPPDPKRDAMIAAAQVYDEVQRDLGELRDQLNAAVAQRDAKDSEIAELRRLLEFQRGQFEKQLEEARSDVQIANQSRDQSHTDRAEALALLSAVQAVLDRAQEHGLEPPPSRRRRNGRHPGAAPAGGAASDVIGGAASDVCSGAAGVSDQAGGGS